MDLLCAKGWEIGLFGSANFIGYTLMGPLIIFLNAMKVGRRKQILFGILGTLLCQSLIYSVHNQWGRYVLRVILGILRLGWVNTYMLICELFPRRHASKITAVFFIWDFSVVILISNVYFQYISNYYLYLCIGSLLLNDLPLCILAFELPDSPKWLIEEGFYDEARSVLQRISNVTTQADFSSIKFKQEFKE